MTNERVRARVVVIDDEPVNIALLTSFLRKVGFETVESTTDSREAMSLVNRFEPDLILLDLHMPHVSGYELLEQLDPVINGSVPIPVLVLTADITEDARQRALKLGARDFISKPFRLAELEMRIGNLVEARLSEQALARNVARLEARVNDEERNGPEAVRRELHRKIESTVADRAVHMVFQPIVDLHNGEATAYEALARFPRPPIEPPNVWFDQAHQVGLGVHLELVAAEVALRAMPGLEPSVRLALNVSEMTLRSPALVDLLRGVEMRRIILEVHEERGTTDLDELSRSLVRLQQMGAQVAVDELGRGSVVFERLLALRPDIVKLDRVLIREIDSDGGRQALVAGLVAYSNRIGATVVAEGIETEAELRTLAGLGVALGQGFFLGRPQPLGPGSTAGGPLAPLSVPA